MSAISFTTIKKKVLASERLSAEEALFLYEQTALLELSALSSHKKNVISGNDVYFNKNIHLEPTNICQFHCPFCSFRRNENESDSWDYSPEEIEKQLRPYRNSDISEIHIVGGVHPHKTVYDYADMLRQVRNLLPQVTIKAFTAVELVAMAEKGGVSLEKCLQILMEAGLQALPGGGAEIFDEKLRKKICGEKSTSKQWLEVHETAHHLGLKSNATMLYGLKETYAHRIDHMNRLRTLQDKTRGFNTFIPLKFRNQNNAYSRVNEISMMEVLKNYAVARLFLDNIPHLKAYWPMTGKEIAQMSLLFGVDDLDGTIDDSTKIYSMAGAEEQNPALTTEQIVALIHECGMTAVERGTNYNIIKIYNK